MATITNLDEKEYQGGRYVVSLASFQRPSDITLYTDGDSISDSASVAKSLVFHNCGSSGVILDATITVNEVDAALAMTLFIFDAEPTGQKDNVARAFAAGDLPNIVAELTFENADKLALATGVDHYKTNKFDSTGQNVLKAYSSSTGHLYGLLECDAAWTPVASTKFTIRLMVDKGHS